MTRPAHDKYQSEIWKRELARETQGYTGPNWRKLKRENSDA